MSLPAGHFLSYYEILGTLGTGAMGEVYRARDTRLEREVAIKVLPEHFAEDQERVGRFEREAKSVAALNHPNVAQIFGVDQAGETYFLVLELVPGETLEDRVGKGALPYEEALDVCRQVAAGVEAAHDAGVIHRDLKPANIRITPDGVVKVLDFGLAKSTGPGGEDPRAESGLETEAGRLLGTPTYMAPEQARGRPVDRRVDVWAFGCILFECLTGERAFQGETLSDVLATVLEKDPEWGRLPAGTPAHVRELLVRCLTKDRRERLRDVGDARLLLGVLDDLPVGEAGTRKAAAGVGALAVCGVLLALLGFAAGWFGKREEARPSPARMSQLTFSGQDHQPHVSPDGRLVAFTSSRTGVSRIWLRQIDGGGEQPLTEGADWRPRFTHDGQSVTFIRSVGDTYSAFRVPTLGGEPRKLIDDVTEVDWAPDGQSVAFLRGSEVELNSIVGVLDLDTGEERVVVNLDGWDLTGLAWSPDGRRLAVTRTELQGGAGGWRTLVLDPVSGEVETHDLAGPRGLVSGATWAGPDALILAVSDTAITLTPVPNPVVRYDLATRAVETLFWSPDLFPFRGSLNPTVQLSLIDDQSLVLDTFQYTQGLTVIDVPDESGVRREILGGNSIDRQPSYHPDGSRILFTSNRAGDVDLFSYEFATGKLSQLTDHPGSDWDGAYTPDGQSILWGSDRSGHLEIWLADLDGSNPRQLTRDGFAAENPTMTRDGEWVVYSSGSPETPGIYKIRADGTDVQKLIGGTYVQPEVSPDGRYALYVSANNVRLSNSIHVLEIETGKVMPFEVLLPYDLRSSNTTYGRGRWLPDGSAIVFVGADEDGNTGLYVQAFDAARNTPETRRKFSGFQGDVVYESFGISPDGSSFVLSALKQVLSIQHVDMLPRLR